MLVTMMMAAAIAATPAAAPGQGLNITGVSAGHTMPAGVTHIEAPPMRSYRILTTPTPTASTTPTPPPRR